MGVRERRRRGRGGSIVDRLRVPRLFGHGDQGVGAVVTLVHAVIAVAPVASVAVVALPVAGIGIRSTDVAENAYFYPFFGVVLAHEHMRWSRGFCYRCHWSAIAMPNKDVWFLMIRRIAPFRCFPFVTHPSDPSKAEPVLAAFFKAITAKANIIFAVVTTTAVVV